MKLTVKPLGVQYKWFRMQPLLPEEIVFVLRVLHPPVHRMNHTSAHSLFVMPHFVLTMSSNVCRRFNSFAKNRKKFLIYTWSIVCVERFPRQCEMRDRERGKKMDKNRFARTTFTEIVWKIIFFSNHQTTEKIPNLETRVRTMFVFQIDCFIVHKSRKQYSEVITVYACDMIHK